MLDIILVRCFDGCVHKTINDLSKEVETEVRKHFRILTCPTSWGYRDLTKGGVLKKECEELTYLANKHQRLKGLFQILSQVNDDEEVVLLDAQYFSCFDVYCWKYALSEYAGGNNLCGAHEHMKYWFQASLYPRYDMLFFADLGYEQYFGALDKSQRICRFCGRSDETGSGKSIFGQPKNSHAISYFIGNNRLFCLEECKACNERFGGTIEKDLSNYYSYFRAAEGRKSRNNNQLTAKGFNFEYKNGRLSVYSDKPIKNAPKIGETIPKGGIRLNLDQESPVCLHNIYKLFVKYVIACIPNHLLHAFPKTVKWINGEIKSKRFILAPVYRNELLESVNSPYLCVYIRKDDKKDLPYCIGELRFMGNLYVYAVPYCFGHDTILANMPAALDRFVKIRYPDVEFKVENYCDDELKLITSHVLIGGGTDEVLEPLDSDSDDRIKEWWEKRNEKMMRLFGTTDLHPDQEYM